MPDFTPDGVLPPGDYELTMEQLLGSMLVEGRAGVTGKHWDVAWRRKLVEGARTLVSQLVQLGIDQIFLDGSFVENKDHPGDIDGYFLCPWEQVASGELERELNLLDPHGVWTWSPLSRQEYSGKWRLPMWMIYRVELYPQLQGLRTRQSTGIQDEFGNDLAFPAAFRRSRHRGIQKGIVKVCV